MQDLGFHFQIIYKDVHLMQLRISAWNGSFGGASDIYIGLDRLQTTVADLRGFPVDPSDVREVTFGSLESHSVLAAASLKFYCVDRAGHTRVDATIKSTHDSAGKAQSVFLTVAIELATLDTFLEELDRLAAAQAGEAFLKGIPTPAY